MTLKCYTEENNFTHSWRNHRWKET